MGTQGAVLSQRGGWPQQFVAERISRLTSRPIATVGNYPPRD
jgi:hypothetical protein